MKASEILQAEIRKPSMSAFTEDAFITFSVMLVKDVESSLGGEPEIASVLSIIKERNALENYYSTIEDPSVKLKLSEYLEYDESYYSRAVVQLVCVLNEAVK